VFPKLRKATVIFVTSIHPSARVWHLGYHWTDYHEIWYLRIFGRSVEKIQVSLKSDKNDGYFIFMIISRWILLRMKNVSEKRCRENQNTHIVFGNSLPPPSSRSYRLWDNVEKYGTAGQATGDNIIRRMPFACWITKATDTHSEYILLIAFPRQNWVRERASVSRLYVHCLSCSLNSSSSDYMKCCG